MKAHLSPLGGLLSPAPPPPYVGVLGHIFKAVVTGSTPFQPCGLDSELMHLIYMAAAHLRSAWGRTSADPQEAHTGARTQLGSGLEGHTDLGSTRRLGGLGQVISPVSLGGSM